MDMIAYTVSYSKTTYHRTTIFAESKEDILGKVAKLIFPQESSHPTEKVSLDDQELEITTEDCQITDIHVGDEE
jgi:hypothetical protein